MVLEHRGERRWGLGGDLLDSREVWLPVWGAALMGAPGETGSGLRPGLSTDQLAELREL